MCRTGERKRNRDKWWVCDELSLLAWEKIWLKYLETCEHPRLEFTGCHYLGKWNSDSLQDLPGFLPERSFIPRMRILNRWPFKKRTLRKSSHWLFPKWQCISIVFAKLKFTGGTFLSMIVRKISIHWVIVWLFTNWSGNAYCNKNKTHSH